LWYFKVLHIFSSKSVLCLNNNISTLVGTKTFFIIGLQLFYPNYQIPASLLIIAWSLFNDHISRGVVSIVLGVRLLDVSCVVVLVCMNVATLPQPLFHHGQRRLQVPVMQSHVSRQGSHHRFIVRGGKEWTNYPQNTQCPVNLSKCI